MGICHRNRTRCTATTAAAQEQSSNEAKIRAQVAAYQVAVNGRNAAAVAALYTADGDLTLYDGPRIAGREAIRQSAGVDLAGLAATVRITISVTSIRFLKPDLAIVETMLAALRVFAAQRP